MILPQISVIVPIYNSEKTISRCVDSLLSQTYNNIEILLIDDGSTDESRRICDEYAIKDNRVKVFHKKNAGVASARQYGVDNAIGKYTIHADPDDWVEPTMLENLLKKAFETKADMVICDYYEEYPKKQVYIKQEPTSLLPSEIIRDLFNGVLHGSTWNKLILKDCYDRYSIKFDKNISFCEDLLVCISLLVNNIKVAYIPQAFYHYDQYSNEKSLVKEKESTRIYSRILVVQSLERIIDTTLFENELYKIKAILITDAFVCDSFNKDNFINLFRVINKRYIEENSFPRSKSILYNCVCLALKGYYRIGKFIYNLDLWIRRV